MQTFNSIEKSDSLNALNYEIRLCEKCDLYKSRKHALTGEGNINADLLFVALSPGAKENDQNKMFVGPSGQVFNRLLAAANIERKSVFMTNLIKCILPKNRKPKWSEIEMCSTFLDDEIAIIQPKIIIPLGYYATSSILQKYHADPSEIAMSFKNINGQLLKLESVKIFPLTHPSALLYNPSFESGTLEKYIKLKSLL
jgi:DNA polymerase